MSDEVNEKIGMTLRDMLNEATVIQKRLMTVERQLAKLTEERAQLRGIHSYLTQKVEALQAQPPSDEAEKTREAA